MTMQDRIRTVYGLIGAHRSKHPESHFFDADTLRFFGERISEMRLLQGTWKVTDYRGEEHECYVLSTYQRKAPGGPRRKWHYFDIETLEVVMEG